jgi:formamidopyrimidine-DNA glycosylase
MPELPEVEVMARVLSAALKGNVIESTLAPGVNALKTFDPPLHALDGAEIVGMRRRGKLLLLDADSSSHGHLTLVIHLMNAGRLQLWEKRSSLRDKTSRVLLRLAGDGERELRLREFGTKQAAWARLLTLEGLKADETLRGLGPEAWPDPPEAGALSERLAAQGARPLHSVLRDQSVLTGIGRTWVDEILHAAKMSPFKRGDDLSDREARTLRDAIAGELGRGVDFYTGAFSIPIPDKYEKPARVHAHQGEPCPRCDTILEAVFFEDYVMTYCPHCQTGGKILKDRRLSRILK